jgi:glycosyltransferase involved in cell wall biosynthesis
VLDGETGLLVKAGDIYELAKSIITLVKNDDLRRRFSVKAREWAKKFTLESAITRLEEVYGCAFSKRNS